MLLDIIPARSEAEWHPAEQYYVRRTWYNDNDNFIRWRDVYGVKALYDL